MTISRNSRMKDDSSRGLSCDLEAINRTSSMQNIVTREQMPD